MNFGEAREEYCKKNYLSTGMSFQEMMVKSIQILKPDDFKGTQDVDYTFSNEIVEI